MSDEKNIPEEAAVIPKPKSPSLTAELVKYPEAKSRRLFDILKQRAAADELLIKEFPDIMSVKGRDAKAYALLKEKFRA